MAFGWYGVLLGEAKVGGRKSSQASVSAATGDELAVHPRGRDFCCPCCWGGKGCSIGMLPPPASMLQCSWQQLAEIPQGWDTNTCGWVTTGSPPAVWYWRTASCLAWGNDSGQQPPEVLSSAF